MLNVLDQVMNLIGDVRGKVAVMVDDMIDTAGESHLLVQQWSSTLQSDAKAINI